MKKLYESPSLKFAEMKLRQNIAERCWAYGANGKYSPITDSLFWNQDGTSIPGYWLIYSFYGTNSCDATSITLRKYVNRVYTGTDWNTNGVGLFNAIMVNTPNPPQLASFHGIANYTYTDNISGTGLDP